MNLIRGPSIMEQQHINEFSEILNQARVTGTPISQLSGRIENFPRPAAYSIQELGIEFREKKGEKIVGLKMGLTSEAKRRQMNLDAPLYGVLTDKMEVKNQGTYHLKGSIHPKIEPEVAFFINKNLEGEVTREEVLAACSGVCATLEILDSRYEHFKYFSMEDVIADNSSSSHFILGPILKDFSHLNLKNLAMKMLVNGEVRESGSSEAISGDPVVSVIELCRLLKERNKFLPAGSVVLAGAATTAVALEKGMTVKLEVEGLEDVIVKIEE